MKMVCRHSGLLNENISKDGTKYAHLETTDETTTFGLFSINVSIFKNLRLCPIQLMLEIT